MRFLVTMVVRIRKWLAFWFKLQRLSFVLCTGFQLVKLSYFLNLSPLRSIADKFRHSSEWFTCEDEFANPVDQISAALLYAVKSSSESTSESTFMSPVSSIITFGLSDVLQVSQLHSCIISTNFVKFWFLYSPSTHSNMTCKDESRIRRNHVNFWRSKINISENKI